jgi:dienelactone hydrolase
LSARQFAVGLAVVGLISCAEHAPRIASEMPNTAPQVLSAAPATPASEWVTFAGEGVTLRALLQYPKAATVPAAQFGSNRKASAVIFLHGCGGVGANGKPSARHQAALDWSVAQGYVAMLVDSFSPRGEREICTQKFSARTITQTNRVADAYAALTYLAARPDVEPTRIALWGWSHGGSTVLSAMRAAPRTLSAQPTFAASIAFYPGCSAFARDAARYTPRAPTHIFIGEADDWTPAAPCLAFAEAMRAAAKPVTITLYPGAYHDFDNPSPTFKKRVRADVPNGVNAGLGVTVGPDPAAREDAMRTAATLLRERFVR